MRKNVVLYSSKCRIWAWWCLHVTSIHVDYWMNTVQDTANSHLMDPRSFHILLWPLAHSWGWQLQWVLKGLWRWKDQWGQAPLRYSQPVSRGTLGTVTSRCMSVLLVYSAAKQMMKSVSTLINHLQRKHGLYLEIQLVPHLGYRNQPVNAV